jgi:hypothetical protein
LGTIVEGRSMSRLRRKREALQPSDPADARDLVELAARMGIPPDDAVRQVERLINEAGAVDRDDARTPAATRP